uniref:Uncharacterized protein n=1 Tax=Esox lucius TaxID=8010 RepID=A0AAY5KMX1_ESOLU
MKGSLWREPHGSCQHGILQAGGGSVKLWGWFSWHSMGPLVCLQTSLTGCTKILLIFQNINQNFNLRRYVTFWLYSQHRNEPKRVMIFGNASNLLMTLPI